MNYFILKDKMFKIEYEESLKTFSSSNKDNIMDKIQIIPSSNEKIKAVEFKYLMKSKKLEIGLTI